MWCWWCCHPFEGQELRLPFKYDALRNRFETMGRFCSWGCMKSFNIDRNGVNQGGIVGQNILVMRKQMTKEPICPVKCAPNRFSLKEFGGTLSIEEFRTVGNATGTIVDMPDEFKRCQLVLRAKYEARATTTETLDTKFSEINNMTTNNETLKLKRPRLLKRESTDNNLEKSLGITRLRK